MENDLHAVVIQAVNKVFANQGVLLPQLRTNIEKALQDNNSGPIAELDARINALEQEILRLTKARKDCDEQGREIIRLREAKYELQLEDAEKESLRQKVMELEQVMDEIGGKAEEYSDDLVRRLIERITVYDEKYVVEFKSGIEEEVAL